MCFLGFFYILYIEYKYMYISGKDSAVDTEAFLFVF